MHIHTIQLNIERVLGGTSHMDAAEFGAYMSLIICCYQKNNKLPCEEKRLARMAKCSLKQWRRVSDSVSEKFTKRDGYWTHLGIQSEIDKYARLSSKNRANRLNNKETEKPKDDSGGTNINNNNQVTNIDTKVSIYSSFLMNDGSFKSGEQLFEEFWKLYPKNRPKGNKEEAKNKFIKVLSEIKKGELTYEDFIRSVTEYNQFCERNYNQHARTWLHQRGWATDWSSQSTEIRDSDSKQRTGYIDAVIGA